MFSDAIKFVMDVGPVVVSTLALLWGGFHVPVVRKLVMLAVKSILAPAVMDELFLALAKKLRDRFDSPVSEAWVHEIEKGIVAKKAARKKK